MWLAANWLGMPPGLDAEISHPENVRKWFNEQQKSSDIPEDLKSAPITSKTIVQIDDQTAAKIGKLVRRTAR